MGIPITIVSGFLGSGKTTLINQALETAEIPKEEIFIIENEFGETGMDHELLLHTKEQVLQLNNGCMCCSLRGDLIAALTDIETLTQKWGLPLSQIIIETTGIADPQPIIQTILTTPTLKNRFYIDSLLTVVDINNVFNYQNEPVSMKQMMLADRLFLSVKDEGQELDVPKVLKQVGLINPLADQLFFSHTSPIEAKSFFKLNKFQSPFTIGETDVGHLELTINEEQETEHVHSREHHAMHAHNSHGFEAISLTTEVYLREELLLRWLDWLTDTHQERLYRFKGIIGIQGHELMIAMQGVNQQVTFSLTPLPCTTTKIILIGKQLDKTAIQKSFDHLCNAYD
ncbi:CobW family GTP-binding protein [Enterococcus villorum]|uniref:Cobalamin synthesis protein CobW n=2 Tax=Enterococcus villorum TaxID=112904 RepID=A0A511J3B1_9ENTE|nr:GTP-binding protein [Enterococcus villorum]EOH86144.1 hypothetical protein UAO_02529 [Enterococcus villorum ATCC 700913]EOW78782.1 hypothetical protein I591_00325 [Enterococcus villorum ATCC 700913]GEL92444.1 cobalamin synthesis protein CobW [Enterococcus villorum]